MKEFLDSVIEYLEGQFDNATSLSKKLNGYYAYEKDLIPTSDKPFFVVQYLNYSLKTESFEEEETIYAPIQITVYGVKMKINNVLYTPQEAAMILGNMCRKYMDSMKYSSSNIITMSRNSISPPLPYEDGSKAYFVALRYKIEIKNND